MDSDSWVKIISIVKDPLSLFTTLALILYAILLAKAPPTENVSMWLVILLGLLMVLVFVLVLKKALSSLAPVKVYLVFKESPKSKVEISGESVNLDTDNCFLNVRDMEGKKKLPISPNLLLDDKIEPKVWYFHVRNIESSDSMTLNLIEHQGGRKWKVKPFTPYLTRVEAYPDLNWER